MNPEAMPTPYDILSISGVPYQPGLLEWLSLLSVLLILTGLFLFLRNRLLKKAQLKSESFYSRTRSTLLEYTTGTATGRKELAVVCLLMRRFLSAVSGTDCTAMDWSELRRVGEKYFRLKPVIISLCHFEEVQYAPAEKIPPVREVAEQFLRDFPEADAVEGMVNNREQQ